MKQVWALILLGIGLVLAGCGSSTTVNGNWTAALMSSNAGNPVFNFSATFTQTSGGNLSITNLQFTTGNPCFAGGATATGGFALSGNMNGVTSGGFQMNIQSAPATGNNQLSLQGTVNNNTITGTWTLTGTTAGCMGSGTFTMNKG
jgi:hypothetical protein